MADVSSLSGVALDLYTEALNNIKSNTTGIEGREASEKGSFQSIFDSALGMITETDKLAAEAEKAAMDFTLGNTESTHELGIIQTKALMSLQYTVAVKNGLLDAYKEIMNMQI